VSNALLDAETRYQKLEKLILTLIVTSRKLKHYFQSFPITVLTEYPLGTILKSPQATGRISKWGTELGAYHIQYEPRTAIRGQVMADFIAEFTPSNPVPIPTPEAPGCWILHVDGASNNKGSKLILVLSTPDDTIIEQSYSLGFQATNNEAEYEALIAGLKMAEILGVRNLEVQCDSLP